MTWPGSAPKDGGYQGLHCASVNSIIADALRKGIVKRKAVALHVFRQIYLYLQQQSQLSHILHCCTV